jgi:hypothetical protein
MPPTLVGGDAATTTRRRLHTAAECTSVTNTLCPLLFTLRTRLALINDHISAATRARVMDRLVDALADLFVDNVIANTHFSCQGAHMHTRAVTHRAGGAQMLFDVTRALLPLLHSMRACNVDDVLSPALARLVQSLRILAFNTATVILLYDSVGMKLLILHALNRSRAIAEKSTSNDASAIGDFDVYNLSTTDVLQLLRLRVDVTVHPSSAIQPPTTHKQQASTVTASRNSETKKVHLVNKP